VSRPGGNFNSSIKFRAGSGLYPFNAKDQLSEHDANCEANARIVRVVHVIPAIDVINVDIIRVVPAYRPRFNESKPIATVLEARISADHSWVAHVEFMLTAKIGMETRVWNSAATPATEAELRLSTLLGHCLLGALRAL
jgi:hypothetical protein